MRAKISDLGHGQCLPALLSLVVGAAEFWPAAAQSPGLPEITVVAPRPPTAAEIAGDNVQTFIRSHGKPGKLIGQLARWRNAPCPETHGLTPAFSDYVTTRILAIAAAVHAPKQSSAHCETNVVIVFTTAPQASIDDVTRHSPQWLGFHYLAETAKLTTIDRPIQAWESTLGSALIVVDTKRMIKELEGR